MLSNVPESSDSMDVAECSTFENALVKVAELMGVEGIESLRTAIDNYSLLSPLNTGRQFDGGGADSFLVHPSIARTGHVMLTTAFNGVPFFQIRFVNGVSGVEVAETSQPPIENPLTERAGLEQMFGEDDSFPF